MENIERTESFTSASSARERMPTNHSARSIDRLERFNSDNDRILTANSGVHIVFSL